MGIFILWAIVATVDFREIQYTAFFRRLSIAQREWGIVKRKPERKLMRCAARETVDNCRARATLFVTAI